MTGLLNHPDDSLPRLPTGGQAVAFVEAGYVLDCPHLGGVKPSPLGDGFS